MIVRLIGMVIAAAAIVIGLGMYLSPDQLKGCEQPGSGECAAADAVVVISGGDTNARTDEAIRLYLQGWAPRLVVSGAAADKTSQSNAAVMRQRALSKQVPAAAVIAEEQSESTKQNAEQVARIVQERSWRRIILVTSGYHMQRASLEFQAQLPGVTIVTHPVARDRQWGPFWWLTPWGWWLAVGELIKIGLFMVGGSR